MQYIGNKLPIVEDFYTLQGEGYHTGKPAYFLRIGGCDIGCRWCDTKFSWNADIHSLVEVDSFITKMLKTPAKAVVVTGGEPLTYNLNYLTTELKKFNIETFLETSGAYPLSGEWNWICLSPKQQNPPNGLIYSKANELKVIIFKKEDLLWAEEAALKVNKNCLLYLQPEWSRYEENISFIVDYILQNPKWSISLQSHKFMHIP
ncbi:MAG: radical SAM protein [Chlorobi bacterium]|nr:radical SAM protein [Chlorobiota bacterium]